MQRIRRYEFRIRTRNKKINIIKIWKYTIKKASEEYQTKINKKTKAKL